MDKSKNGGQRNRSAFVLGKVFSSVEVHLQRHSAVGKLFTCDVSQHVAVSGKQLEEGCYYPPKEPIKEPVTAPAC